MTNTISKGTVGVTAPAVGIALSHMAVNEWLQTVALLAGIAVSVASFVSIVKKLRSQK